MFVATKEIKVVDRNDRITIFRVGDEVVGFENWDEIPKRAHLSLEYVIEVKNQTKTKKIRTPKPKKG